MADDEEIAEFEPVTQPPPFIAEVLEVERDLIGTRKPLLVGEVPL